MCNNLTASLNIFKKNFKVQCSKGKILIHYNGGWFFFKELEQENLYLNSINLLNSLSSLPTKKTKVSLKLPEIN